MQSECARPRPIFVFFDTFFSFSISLSDRLGRFECSSILFTSSALLLSKRASLSSLQLTPSLSFETLSLLCVWSSFSIIRNSFFAIGRNSFERWWMLFLHRSALFFSRPLFLYRGAFFHRSAHFFHRSALSLPKRSFCSGVLFLCPRLLLRH